MFYIKHKLDIRKSFILNYYFSYKYSYIIYRSEHQKHRPDCEFVKIKKNSDEYTVRDWIRLLAYANSVQMVFFFINL